MKRLFTSALCALTLLTLAACGGGEAKDTPTPMPAPTTGVEALPTPSPENTPVALPTPTPSALPIPTPTPASTTAVAPLTTAEVSTGGWMPHTERAEVGADKPAALTEASVSDGVLSLCFAPAPTEEGINAFLADSGEPPRVSAGYNAEYGVLFITLYHTTLSSGEPQPGEEDWVYDHVRDQGLSYPYYVATGSLGEDNSYFTKSAISSDGTDVTITLMLTDKAGEYRVETGLGASEMLRTVTLSFREVE